MREGMTIGVLASQAGLTAETLRYYERRGLVTATRRTPAGPACGPR